MSDNHANYINFVNLLNNPNFDIEKDIIPQAQLNVTSKKEEEILDRMKGCLLGLSIGDAVGGPYEFEGSEIRKKYPATKMIDGGLHGLSKGEWTDDTSMALCLAVSLICKGKSHQYDQLMRYNWWVEKGYLSSRHSCFDIGNLTRYAINEFKVLKRRLFNSINMKEESLIDDLKITGEIVDKVMMHCGRDYGNRKAGNGSLMRLAPVPLFFYGNVDLALIAAEESSTTTHDDPLAVEACKFYASLIIGAFEGFSKDSILEKGFYENYTKKSLETKEISEIANGSYKVGIDTKLNGSGYVCNSLKGALWAFYNDNGSFEKGVFLAINLGDDTDTTAAIYGQLAGAVYGLKEIPKIWQKDVLHEGAIIKIAEWLFYCNRKHSKTI